MLTVNLHPSVSDQETRFVNNIPDIYTKNPEQLFKFKKPTTLKTNSAYMIVF